MGIAYNTSLSPDGLIVYIDAANPKCYPGSGSTAFNLVKNSINGTLSGGVGYNSSNKGVFSFDGVNDVIVFGTGETVFPLTQISYEFVFRSFGTVPTTGTAPSLIGLTYGVRLFVNTTSLSANFDDGVAFPGISTSGSNNYQNGNWYHVTVTHDGLNLRIYVNGVLSNSGTSTWLGTTRWPTNTFNIGRDNNNVNYYFYGEIPIFRLYNKALSADDVSKSFRSIRGRFGL
jgi:hypothetical protein